MKKLLIPAALLLALSLTACGEEEVDSVLTELEAAVTEADGAVSEASEEAEPVTETEPEEAPVVSASALFEDFVDSVDWSYGNTYSIDLPSDFSEANNYATRDLTPLMDLNLGYAIYDLDMDGEDELLVAQAAGDDCHVKVTVCEVTDGALTEAASWDMETVTSSYGYDYDLYLPLTESVVEADDPSEFSQVFIYTLDGQTLIGLENHSYADLLADGSSALFICLQYDGSALSLIDYEGTAGSDFDDETAGEIASHLAELGASVDFFDWIWRQDYLADHLDVAARLFGYEATYYLNYQQGYSWMQNPKAGLHLEDLKFDTREELNP